jgi:hypothetical protein
MVTFAMKSPPECGPLPFYGRDHHVRLGERSSQYREFYD